MSPYGRIRWRFQFRLATLFLAIAVVSAALGIRSWREHQYRIQLAAINVLGKTGQIGIGRGVKGPWETSVQMDDEILERDHAVVWTLKRDDVVAAYSHSWSDSTSVSSEELAALMCFPTLRELDFVFTRVMDTQLAEIAKLRSVEKLTFACLHRPEAADSFSDAGVQSLAALRSLRLLDLSGRKISGAGFAAFSSARALKVLNLQGTAVDDENARHLASLPALESLNLAGTSVTDEGVRRLAASTSLRTLQLDQTGITDAASIHLSQMTRLEMLSFGDDNIGDESLRRLASLPKLHTLTLYAARITDDGLKSLQRSSSLRSLFLNECGITDRGLLYLSGMKRLKAADLRGVTSISAAGLAELRKLRPDLIVSWDAPEL
jgi:hypothetical protein